MEALGPQGTAVFFCCLSYYILRKYAGIPRQKQLKEHTIQLLDRENLDKTLSGYNTAKNKSNLVRHRREVGFLENIPEESPYIFLEKNKPLFFQVSLLCGDGCPLTALLNILYQPNQIQLENKWATLDPVTNRAMNSLYFSFLFYGILHTLKFSSCYVWSECLCLTKY